MPLAFPHGALSLESLDRFRAGDTIGHLFDQFVCFGQNAVHALSTERTCDVRSVTGEPDAPTTKTARQAPFEVRDRAPLDHFGKFMLPGGSFGQESVQTCETPSMYT